MTDELDVHLFYLGGGAVLGTHDVRLARAALLQGVAADGDLAELHEAELLTMQAPAIGRGRMQVLPTQPLVAQWMPCRDELDVVGTVDAVVWHRRID